MAESWPIAGSKLRPARNLLFLSLSFLLMFTSYQGLASLQSSVNTIGGLGAAGLAVTYACVVPSSLVLAPLALDRLGSKWTMSAGLLGYLLYFGLNLVPTWATVIPGSAVLGLCGAPLWAAMSLHVVRLAGQFDEAKDAGSADASKVAAGRSPTVSIFFGAFFTIVTSCTIWGNLISYLTLTDHSGTTRDSNSTAMTNASAGNFSCGYKFCSAAAAAAAEEAGAGPGGGEDGSDRPSMAKFYTMMACFIAAAALSVLVMTFLVDREAAAPGADKSATESATDGATNAAPPSPPPSAVARMAERTRRALLHLGEPRQLLLAPLTISAGLSQSFSLGDFTEGFVACSSGVGAVGLVMMTYGASQVVTGLLAGQVAARVGQAPVLLTASFGLLAMLIGSLYWEVGGPEPQWPLHAMAAAWGAVDSVWVTLLNALYGNYFLEDAGAAFSALRFLQSLGFILGFSYNKLLCVEQKLYVMISLLCPSIVTFVACVILNRRVRRIAPVIEPVKE